MTDYVITCKVDYYNGNLKLGVSCFENILAVIGLKKDQSVLNNANSGALYSIFC